jgi:hypothetical protein
MSTLEMWHAIKSFVQNYLSNITNEQFLHDTLKVQKYMKKKYEGGNPTDDLEELKKNIVNYNKYLELYKKINSDKIIENFNDIKNKVKNIQDEITRFNDTYETKYEKLMRSRTKSDIYGKANDIKIVENVARAFTDYRKGVLIGLYGKTLTVPIEQKMDFDAITNSMGQNIKDISEIIDRSLQQIYTVEIGLSDSDSIQIKHAGLNIKVDASYINKQKIFLNTTVADAKKHNDALKKGIDELKKGVEGKFDVKTQIKYEPKPDKHKIIERIYNNIIARPISETDVKLKLLGDLVATRNGKPVIVFDEINYKIPPDIAKKSDIEVTNAWKLGAFLYNPKGEWFNRDYSGDHSGGNPPIMLSGLLIECKDKLDELNTMKEAVIKTTNEYNLWHVRWVTFHVYLMLIATSQLYTESYVIINYINYGIINYYLKLINDIIKKIDSDNSELSIQYLSKYHYITLQMFKGFFEYIKTEIIRSYPPNMTSKKLQYKSVFIDINNCSDDIKKYFYIFNHFKSILDTYKNMFASKISVYCRLNDYEDQYNCGLLKQPNSELVFYASTKDDENNLLFINTNGCPIFDTFEYNEFKQKFDKLKKNNDIYQISFTEVTDTYNFPHNEDLSTYMGMTPKLLTGQSIMMLTYGYSGTGKSHTLFGSSKLVTYKCNNVSSQIDPSNGLLLGTLANMDNLQYVKLRIFELYGYGVGYTFYWGEASDIHQHIYAYALSSEGQRLVLENIPNNPKTVNPNKIQKYANEAKTPDIAKQSSEGYGYYTIKSAQIGDFFGNFDKLVQDIEKIREKSGRVRQTPNNPVSSRSILVFDFQLRISGVDEYTSFVIVDLPGREELVPSYVTPFMTFLDKVNSKEGGTFFENDEHKQYIKTIMASVASNPLYLAIFEPDIIIYTVNEILREDTTLITKQLDINTKMEVYSNNNKIPLSPEDPTHVNYLRAAIAATRKNKSYVVSGVDEKLLSIKVKSEFIKEPMFIEYYPDDDGDVNISALNNIIKIENNQIKFIDSTYIDPLNEVKRKENDIQIHVIVAVHLLNRLIALRRFNILNTIARRIMDKHVNNKLREILERVDNKDITKYIEQTRPLLLELFSKADNESDLDKQKEMYERARKNVLYDYTITSYEGIYINENIMGLLKYLLTIKQNVSDEKIRKIILEQSKINLDFSKQKMNVLDNVALYKPSGAYCINYDETYQIDNKSVIKSLYPGGQPYTINDEVVGWNQICIDHEILKKIYKSINEEYNSDALFNYNRPLIQDILEPYLDKINDFKLFYLLNNNGQTNKCAPQLKLLAKSALIIEELCK